MRRATQAAYSDPAPVLAAHPPTPRPQPRSLANATILQIVPSLRDDSVGRTALQCALGLMQSGARALVAGASGPLVGTLQTAGGEWIPFAGETINPLKLHRNAMRLEQMISSERIDVIHAYGAGAAWSALSATANLPVWLVTSMPDQLPAGWLRGFYAGALARGDRVVTGSSHAGRRAMERFEIPAGRLAVVPHSVDMQRFDPACIDARRIAAFRAAARIQRSHERIILVPGRISAARGHHILVEAAAILANRGLRDCIYVLAGDDQSDRVFVRTLMGRIKSLGLDPVFRITSLFRDTPAALAAAHAVVLPALESPLAGRAVAQAQAMARPVITTGVGVLPETVLAPPRMPDELRTGWLVRPGHPGELAAALDVAMRLDGTAYQALAARARQFAQFMFSPESVVGATRAIYTSLLARDR